MLAIILAGGRGERLRPLTETTPKVLLPVQGRALVEHVIELLVPAGVDEIVLATAYLGDKVRQHFAGRNFGVSLRLLDEGVPRGTAGPLLMLRELGQIPTDDFFLVNGDNLFNLNFSDLLQFHRSHPGAATIALTAAADPSSFGVARLDGSRIVEFVENHPAARRRATSLTQATMCSARLCSKRCRSSHTACWSTTSGRPWQRPGGYTRTAGPGSGLIREPLSSTSGCSASGAAVRMVRYDRTV